MTCFEIVTLLVITHMCETNILIDVSSVTMETVFQSTFQFVIHQLLHGSIRFYQVSPIQLQTIKDRSEFMTIQNTQKSEEIPIISIAIFVFD